MIHYTISDALSYPTGEGPTASQVAATATFANPTATDETAAGLLWRDTDTNDNLVKVLTLGSASNGDVLQITGGGTSVGFGAPPNASSDTAFDVEKSVAADRQDIPKTGVKTTITWNATEIIDGTADNFATNTYTVPKAGNYYLYLTAVWAEDGLTTPATARDNKGTRTISIEETTTGPSTIAEITEQPSSNKNIPFVQHISRLHPAAATDTIVAQAAVSTTAQAANSLKEGTFFGGYFVSAINA